MPGAVAILPIKRFEAAKQRLAHGVPAPARRELAAAMAADVLEALGQVGGLDAIVVVTGEPAVAELAEAAGAELVRDERDAGQSAAALRGLEHPTARIADRALLVPGDCPALEPAEIELLLAGAAPAPSVAVIPDRHETGTNGLLLSPPGAIAPAFGPGSFARHVEAGRTVGAAVHVERLPSLALDVDTPGDLAALRDALAALPRAAHRTRAALERLTAAG